MIKVLKFGGSSVRTSENIKHVLGILKQYTAHENVICVVSAIGGTTDNLFKAGKLALDKDDAYEEVFEDIKNNHLDIVSDLLPKTNDELISYLTYEFNNLKTLLHGIYLINELTPKTLDKLASFGELISSRIITEVANDRGMNTHNKNSQDLIITNSNFNNAEINYSITNKNIQDYFKKPHQLTILPGLYLNLNMGKSQH